MGKLKQGKFGGKLDGHSILQAKSTEWPHHQWGINICTFKCVGDMAHVFVLKPYPEQVRHEWEGRPCVVRVRLGQERNGITIKIGTSAWNALTRFTCLPPFSPISDRWAVKMTVNYGSLSFGKKLKNPLWIYNSITIIQQHLEINAINVRTADLLTL